MWDPKRRRYYFGQISLEEREFLEMVLMGEIEIQIQTWYAVTYSVILSEEVYVCVQ